MIASITLLLLDFSALETTMNTLDIGQILIGSDGQISNQIINIWMKKRYNSK